MKDSSNLKQYSLPAIVAHMQICRQDAGAPFFYHQPFAINHQPFQIREA